MSSDVSGSKSARRLVVSQGFLSVGATLASFGIDVWFYQSSSSYANFALIYIAAVLPPILVSPVAGFVADRISKPRLLYLAQVCTLVLLAILMALYLLDVLHLYAIVSCVFLMAAAGEFRYTATTALIPELVKQTELTSINGTQQAFRGGVAIIGPLLGAVGYHYFGLLTLLGAATLFAVYATYVADSLARSIPMHQAGGRVALGQFVADYLSGLKWLRTEPQLKTVLLHFTIVFGFLSVFRALTVPHLLDVRGEDALAMVVSAQGAGLLFVGLVLAKVRPLQNFDAAVFVGCHLLGVAIVLFGLSSDLLGLTSGSFVIGACISLVATSNQSLWQSRTPRHLQGRMVAVRSVGLYVLSPVVIYLSVPAAKHIEREATIGGLRWTGMLIVGLGIAVLIASAFSQLSYRRTSDERDKAT